ncbi:MULTISPECIES: HEAT repeat domain-containing protein [unclassified Caballeronia]|uniref:HEAT repeat domain-containing protein n=1 Tax=Caballeronia sp. M1242 TaxID=2814653 RepID=UPI001588D3AD|nr:HEAT repeat domain-containing protein [Caballeronia sp. M1242]
MVQALGYQGGAALEILSELSKGDDSQARAAAVTGLGHISSPLEGSILQDRINDRDPEVRRALIRRCDKASGQ